MCCFYQGTEHNQNNFDSLDLLQHDNEDNQNYESEMECSVMTFEDKNTGIKFINVDDSLASFHKSKRSNTIRNHKLKKGFFNIFK